MPKIINHHDKKDSILGNVSKLILKGTLETAGVREIAKAANVSVGALTHYFGSKEDVYDALITRAGERTNWHLQKAISSAKNKRQRLVQILDYVLKNEDEMLIQLLIVLDAARSRAVKEREKRAKQERSEEIYFKILVSECELSHAQARFFITNSIGMLTRRLWTGKSIDEKPQISLILKAIGV